MKIKEGGVVDIKEEILAQMDSALRPEFDKAIDNTIEGAFKEDVKTLGSMVANSIKCQWEVMKPHLFYAYCLGVKAQEAKAQAVPEWISVEDKLPEIGVYVMVFLEKQGHNPTTYNFCQYTKFGFHLSNVTHWAPLPEPPETQEPANEN